MITLRKWNRIDHVLRIENTGMCSTAITWYPGGRRKVGRPKLHGGEVQSRNGCALFNNKNPDFYYLHGIKARKVIFESSGSSVR